MNTAMKKGCWCKEHFIYRYVTVSRTYCNTLLILIAHKIYKLHNHTIWYHLSIQYSWWFDQLVIWRNKQSKSKSSEKDLLIKHPWLYPHMPWPFKDNRTVSQRQQQPKTNKLASRLTSKQTNKQTSESPYSTNAPRVVFELADLEEQAPFRWTMIPFHFLTYAKKLLINKLNFFVFAKGWQCDHLSKKRGHFFYNTPPPKKNNGTIEPRRNPWVHHQQLVTLLKVHQLSECWLRTPILHWQFHHRQKKHVVSMSLMGGIKPWITSTPWRRKCLISSWKVSASPLLRPCLGSHCYLEISGLNIRQLGELFRSQIPQKFWVNDWNQHQKDLMNWRNTLKTKTLETSR